MFPHLKLRLIPFSAWTTIHQPLIFLKPKVSLALLDLGPFKLPSGNFKWPPFWNGATLWPHILRLLVSFHALCIISDKTETARTSCVPLRSCTSRALPTSQNPRYWFCGYNWHNSLMNFSIDTNKSALLYSFWHKCGILSYL